METLAAAYVAAWVAVGAYVVWLVMQNKRLAERLDAMDREKSERRESPFPSKAA